MVAASYGGDVHRVGGWVPENYRGISWGMDAPGRGVSVRFNARF